MSLSNPEVKKPYDKTITFKGKTGLFVHWDKDKGEAGENIPLKFPLKFIVLDQLNSITGFNDASSSGIYSNQIRNLKNEELTVRAFKGDMCIVGLYSNVSDAIKARQGKFCKDIYAAMVTPEGLELVMFKFSGSIMGEWFTFQKKADLLSAGVMVKKLGKAKKGVNEYFVPIFESIETKSETISEAIKMDKILQKYLNERMEHGMEANIAAAELHTNDDDEIAERFRQQDESGLPDSEESTVFIPVSTEDCDDDLPF